MKSYDIGEKLVCKKKLEIYYWDNIIKKMCKDYVSVGDVYIVDDIVEYNEESVEYTLVKIDDDDVILALYNDKYKPFVDLHFDRMR